MDIYNITKDKDGDQWKFAKVGNQRASMTAGTKAEIIKKVQKYMVGKIGTVKIHKENGQIQEERTYPRKHDPRNIKG